MPVSSLVLWGLALLPGHEASAQSGTWAHVGASAVAASFSSDPVPGGGSETEIRVVQPTMMVHAGALERLRFTGMLNLEGATIPHGELALGDWGEGFVDRRHPHTYVHELLLTGDDLLGSADGETRVSLTAGKGFAPFGTDDPMVRGFVRYPVNHHLSQILERAVAIAAVRVGPMAAELGAFNGDEPERPGQWPRISGRFGDSWSSRLTGRPVSGLEVQGSFAHVHSPEHRPGAGTDQAKWSLSARWSRALHGHPLYGLVEWARTSEAEGFFVFHSVLAEGAWTVGHHRLQLRIERTGRPEEERIGSFRSLRPHLENSILGTTRWSVGTAGYQLVGVGWGPARIEPLLELSFGRIDKVGGGFFDIDQLYGGRDFWAFTLGVRISAGSVMHRMGRYGAAEEPETAAMGHHMM